MSNYNSLKTTIDANIKQNGRQEITGQILNSVLNQMVTTLGAGYQFAGVATTATNPGTPDAKVFYIANGKGTYTNFGGINVTEDDVVVLYWDTAWHKEATGIASQEKLSELESEINQEKKRAETSEQHLQESIDSVKEETLAENREMVNSILENYAPVEITGDVNNAADEEDLTSVNVDGTDVLKFKDKVYNPLVYSGLGRKILRKNIVDGVNTLTQSMMQDTNTIYVIQYDFTLGEDITVPANCVLEFDGGSITNGSIIGQNTNIVAGRIKIFDTSVVIGGSWAINECYPEWMGVFPGSIIYDLGTVIASLNRFNCTVCFGTGAYKTNTPVKLVSAKGCGATKTILDGIFTANNSYTAYVGNIEYPYDGLYREQAWVKDMMIRVSPDADSTLTGCSALYIGNINDLYLESCRFANDYETFTEANRLIALKTDDKNLEKKSPRAVTVYGSLNGGRFVSCYFQGQTDFFIEDNANADTCNFSSCVFDGGVYGGYANFLLHGACSGISIIGETSFERMSYAIKGYTTPHTLSIYGARSEQATMLYDDNNKILGSFLYIKTDGDSLHPDWTFITLNCVEFNSYQNGVFIECYEIKAVFSNILMRYESPVNSIKYSAHLHASSNYSQITCENCKFPTGPSDISGLAIVESGVFQAQEMPTFLHDCKMISSNQYAINANLNTCIKQDMYSETYLVNTTEGNFFVLMISRFYSANLDKYTVLEGKTFIDRYDISTGNYVDTLYCHFMFDNTFSVTYLTFDTTKGVEIRGRNDDKDILVYNTDYNLRMRGEVILHLKGELV